MSKVRIERALEKKGIATKELHFERSIPVPEETVFGWEIELTEETELALYLVGYKGSLDPDARNTTDMLNWIENLPDLSCWPKPGEIFPVRMIDNSMGDRTQFITLACIDNTGCLTDYETGKGLLEYEGNQLLEWWPPLAGRFSKTTLYNL